MSLARRTHGASDDTSARPLSLRSPPADPLARIASMVSSLTSPSARERLWPPVRSPAAAPDVFLRVSRSSVPETSPVAAQSPPAATRPTVITRCASLSRSGDAPRAAQHAQKDAVRAQYSQQEAVRGRLPAPVEVKRRPSSRSPLTSPSGSVQGGPSPSGAESSHSSARLSGSGGAGGGMYPLDVDVSKNSDSKGHGIDVDAVPTFLPPTRLPEEYHITDQASHIPVGEDPAEWKRVGPRTYVKQLFPSLKPTGRQEAVLLTELYDKLSQSFELTSLAASLPETILEFQSLQSACMFELVRQVSVHCLERGVLLKRVWEGYDSLLLKLGEAQKEELLKCKNNNGCVLAALQSELEKVLKLLADSQQRVKFLEALLESGETQTVLDLREIIARMQADQADLEKRLAEALAEKENAMQGWALCQKQVSSLEAALAERDQQLIAAEAECKRLQELCDALQRELAKAQADLANLPTPVQCVDAGIQTDPIPEQIQLQPPPEEEEVAPAPVVEKKRKRSGSRPCWPLETTLKAIQRIYADKIRADEADDARNHERQNMDEYLEDWFTHNYGDVHKDIKNKFANTIKKYSKTNSYCQTFGRLWGLFDPLDEAMEHFYLAVLAPLIEARADREAVIPLPQASGHMIHVRTLTEVARKQLGVVLDPKLLAAFLARIPSAAEQFGPLGHRYMEQERFMSMMRQERQAMLDRLSMTLRRLFRAGDVNGDGVLDLDEFSLLVRYVDRTTPLDTIRGMYQEARGEGAEALNPDDFVRVCFQYGLLTSDAAKTRLLVSQVADMADTFGELEAQWKRAELGLTSTVTAVADPTRRNALQQRLRKVDELLEQREDIETTHIAVCLTTDEVLRCTPTPLDDTA